MNNPANNRPYLLPNPALTTVNKTANKSGQQHIDEIRQSIFQFQREMDEADQKKALEKKNSEPNLAAAARQSNNQDNDFEKFHAQIKLEKRQKSRAKDNQSPTSITAGIAATTTNTTTTSNKWNPAAIFFRSPKPMRPQLHTFI